MIYLLPDTAGQSMYMTLRERVKDLPSFSRYLIIFEQQLSGERFAFIADVTTENERYTKMAISTNVDEPTAGNILITQFGLYNYFVYGQNSNTNLDITNTVGEVERGVVRFVTEEEYYFTPTITITDNIIYYEG